jgi:hypothetical protein
MNTDETPITKRGKRQAQKPCSRPALSERFRTNTATERRGYNGIAGLREHADVITMLRNAGPAWIGNLSRADGRWTKIGDTGDRTPGWRPLGRFHGAIALTTPSYNECGRLREDNLIEALGLADRAGVIVLEGTEPVRRIRCRHNCRKIHRV